jgi:hypothetical protein
MGVIKHVGCLSARNFFNSGSAAGRASTLATLRQKPVLIDQSYVI